MLDAIVYFCMSDGAKPDVCRRCRTRLRHPSTVSASKTTATATSTIVKLRFPAKAGSPLLFRRTWPEIVVARYLSRAVTQTAEPTNTIARRFFALLPLSSAACA